MDDLTPEQEAEVRRLLADARPTEPIPDQVAARLDRVLADLAAEPAREATVTRLADRRRRAGVMLVAAAAVVVAGIGLGQVLGGGGSDEVAAGSAGESAADADRQAPRAAEDAPSEETLDDDGSGPTGATEVRPYRLRSQDFTRDADRLRSSAAGLAAGYDAGKRLDGVVRADRRTVCEAGDWGRGGYVAVLYDGDPGWLVVRPVQGETQVADLFLCGSRSAARSVTLPAP